MARKNFWQTAKALGWTELSCQTCLTKKKAPLAEFCRKYGVDLIPLVAPTSDERIKMIAKDAEGYVYIVSSIGVTGVRSDITTDIAAMTEKIRQATDVPAAVGFGIATPKQAEEMASVSTAPLLAAQL